VLLPPRLEWGVDPPKAVRHGERGGTRSYRDDPDADPRRHEDQSSLRVMTTAVSSRRLRQHGSRRYVSSNLSRSGARYEELFRTFPSDLIATPARRDALDMFAR
jgi:hypothetical protein